jgi:hypothetical protein
MSASGTKRTTVEDSVQDYLVWLLYSRQPFLLTIIKLLKARGAVKLEPVLVPREPGPDLCIPIPQTPDRGWGRHYLDQTVAFSRSGKLELLLL